LNWYNDWGQVSFGDEHINGILSQALKQDENMKLDKMAELFPRDELDELLS